MINHINFKTIITITTILFFSSIVYSAEYYSSLKKNKVNVRYGPSFDSPIKYIYKKINLPIKVIDKQDNFRRIIDFKNNSGWIHISQLKKINSLIPLKDKILFQKPSNFSKPIANVKKGRVLVILKCEDEWCKIKTGELKGWIKNENSWGQVN